VDTKNQFGIFHAAGNDSKGVDVVENYPNRRYADGSGEAAAWLEVGASGTKSGYLLPANFSNYGKHTRSFRSGCRHLVVHAG
jgi:hypothetical protein